MARNLSSRDDSKEMERPTYSQASHKNDPRMASKAQYPYKRCQSYASCSIAFTTPSADYLSTSVPDLALCNHCFGSWHAWNAREERDRRESKREKPKAWLGSSSGLGRDEIRPEYRMPNSSKSYLQTYIEAICLYSRIAQAGQHSLSLSTYP